MTRWGRPKRSGSLAPLALALVWLGFAASAQAADRFDVLQVDTRGAMQPVQGSDGRRHLVYELRLQNLSAQFAVKVERVDIVDARRNRTVASLSGAALADDMDLGDPFALVQTTELEPAQAATVWLHPSFAKRAPRVIRHVLWVAPGAGVDPAEFDLRYGRRVVTPRARVDTRAPLLVRSPLRGGRYVAISGCCVSRHARSALAVGAHQWVSQRFAVDWVRVSKAGLPHRGDGTKLRQHYIYGERIHAAARGRVVRAVDRFQDTPPFERDDSTVTPKRAAGNHVIIRHGPRRFALYAHIKPGTVKVERGERVRAAQVIGRVGSSGNSDAPHLHFHVTDRPSPIGADGVPYRYRRYALQGRVGAGDEVVWFKRKRPRRASLPLGDTVAAFPKAP
jgi:hypothetical protein